MSGCRRRRLAIPHRRIDPRPQDRGDQRCQVRWLTYLIDRQRSPIRKGCVKSERMQAVGAHKGYGAPWTVRAISQQRTPGASRGPSSTASGRMPKRRMPPCSGGGMGCERDEEEQENQEEDVLPNTLGWRNLGGGRHPAILSVFAAEIAQLFGSACRASGREECPMELDSQLSESDLKDPAIDSQSSHPPARGRGDARTCTHVSGRLPG